MKGHPAVARFLAGNGVEIRHSVEETPTVEAAAQAVGCHPAQIAKSVVLLIGASAVLVVASGDRKVNSSLLKRASGFCGRVRLPDGALVEELTGYPVGGVCPFLLPENLPVLLDASLRRFGTVYPAAGCRHSTATVPTLRLSELTGGVWAEVTIQSPS